MYLPSNRPSDCDECGRYECRESNSDAEMIIRSDFEGNLVDIMRGPIEKCREECKKALWRKKM